MIAGERKDEELFRSELKRYAESPLETPITPSQVPPLVPSHLLAGENLLRPTAKNKMFNAHVHFENFGKRWTERVLAPYESTLKQKNGKALRTLLRAGDDLGEIGFSLRDPKEEARSRLEWSGEVYRVTKEAMVVFLKAYKWMGEQPLLQRPIDFLGGTGDEDPGVTEWLLIGPRRKTVTMGTWLPDGRFPLMQRSRLGGDEKSSFKAFSERRHRLVARYLAGLGDQDQDAVAANKLRGSGVGVGVALVYHVVESSKDVEGVKVDDQAEIDSVVTVGFGLQFPANTLSTAVVFGVKDPTRHDAVIVEADLPDESE